MHARLAARALELMASDTMPDIPYVAGSSVALNLACDSPDQVDRLFAALAAGGNEVMAPHDAVWGARFAMAVHRFGIPWMLNHEYARTPGG